MQTVLSFYYKNSEKSILKGDFIMPIKEESFRIGCGRYIQGRKYIEKVGKELEFWGTAPLIIGDSTSLSLTETQLENALKHANRKTVVHNAPCNIEDAEKLAEFMKENNLDTVIGVGGGVIMDFAKLVADISSAPVINIPTSSATCAAYTPLSVCYTPEGRTVGSRHYKKEVNCVIADTEIISRQPVRLLLSGVFDSLAKFIEIKQRYNESVTDYPLGLNWAYVLSKGMFFDLCALTEQAINNPESDALEKVVFSLICTTGVISGIARGSNQCALAHKFYEISRKIFFEETRHFLHGEIVGIGLLLQNFFNGESENNEFLLSLAKKYGMPRSVSDIGLSADGDTKQIFFEQLSASSAIDSESPIETAKLADGLDYLFGIK